MRKLISLAVLGLAMGCQSESLDIQANYRIKLNANSPAQTLTVHSRYTLSLELLTDSYYPKEGYQLEFYQQTGLGRLEQVIADDAQPVFQKVPVSLPLGKSLWQYIPEATGTSQVVLVARQGRGYTQPDTVRLDFKVVP